MDEDELDIIHRSAPSSPKLHSTSPYPYPPTPPPTYVAPPPTGPPTSHRRSAPVPSPSSVSRLDQFRHILTADGYYSLSDYEDRVFRVWSCSGKAALEQLRIFLNLRKKAPPGRWADLGGTIVTGGHPTAVTNPEIYIGSALAGRIPEDMGCRYTVFEISKLEKTSSRTKDESAHLYGDRMYRWFPYECQEQVLAGLQESCYSSFSVPANWAEVRVSDESEIEALQERFIGEPFTDGEDKFFAIVGLRQ